MRDPKLAHILVLNMSNQHSNPHGPRIAWTYKRVTNKIKMMVVFSFSHSHLHVHSCYITSSYSQASSSHRSWKWFRFHVQLAPGDYSCLTEDIVKLVCGNSYRYLGSWELLSFYPTVQLKHTKRVRRTLETLWNVWRNVCFSFYRLVLCVRRTVIVICILQYVRIPVGSNILT